MPKNLPPVISCGNDGRLSFRDLFRFAQKEVSFTFDHILDKKYYRGLKLLKSTLVPGQNHGKMLVITPRASGKAHKRNRIRRQLKNIYFQEKCYQDLSAWIVIVSDKATKIPFDALKLFLVSTIRNQEPS